MFRHLKKKLHIVLVISTGCLSLTALHAQTRGISTTNSAVVYNDYGDIKADNQSNQYRYNPLNQLIYNQATRSNKTINYQYYATGMQASESVAPGSSKAPSPTLHHYYVGQGQLLNSVQDNNFSGYLLANDMALRSYQSANNPQAQIYVRNRHSSVITTISSKTTQTQQYNAYGETTLKGTSSSAKILETYGIHTSPLAYSNYPFDTAADIYYLKARYYAPIYRSFLSRDGYDLTNRYWYINDNPLMGKDPNGHTPLFDSLSKYLDVHFDQTDDQRIRLVSLVSDREDRTNSPDKPISREQFQQSKNRITPNTYMEASQEKTISNLYIIDAHGDQKGNIYMAIKSQARPIIPDWENMHNQTSLWAWQDFARNSEMHGILQSHGYRNGVDYEISQEGFDDFPYLVIKNAKLLQELIGLPSNIAKDTSLLLVSCNTGNKGNGLQRIIQGIEATGVQYKQYIAPKGDLKFSQILYNPEQWSKNWVVKYSANDKDIVLKYWNPAKLSTN